MTIRRLLPLRRVLQHLLFLVLIFSIAAPIFAQQWSWPEEFENLKVLPETTTSEEMAAVMRGFTQALGVRCQHCHDDTDGNQLSQMDFAADTKEAKEIARVMLRMVNRINKEELTKLEHAKDKDILQVTCKTCHRGNKRPEFIEEILMAETVDNGVESAKERYRKLRDRYYGGFTYDFSERMLLRVAWDLEAEGMSDETIEFMLFNLEWFPDSWQTHGFLAQVYQRLDNIPQALEHAEKALALSPENRALQRLVEGLTNG